MRVERRVNSVTTNAGVLFQPLKLGAIEVPNRIFMAPLTRNRATHEGDVPHAMNAEYYAQRASAGLIISEATQISQQGKGYKDTPGVYSDDQVAGWKLVTDAVHARGGRIVLQLWHVGRVSHPSLQPRGERPVAPSAVPFETKVFTDNGFEVPPTPRALRADELPGIVSDFARGAKNAMAAGFDGVEVHSANGYLLEQFLKDGSNLRDDAYGGSIENRMRFPLEVMAAVTAAAGANRVGIRISPQTTFAGISETDPMAVYGAYVDRLATMGLAYLHVIEGQTGGPRAIEPPVDYLELKRRFGGAYVANNGYDRALAIENVAAGKADAIAFGVKFLANPDLVQRLRDDAPLNDPDQATFYGGDAKGYTDYPALTTV